MSKSKIFILIIIFILSNIVSFEIGIMYQRGDGSLETKKYGIIGSLYKKSYTGIFNDYMELAKKYRELHKSFCECDDQRMYLMVDVANLKNKLNRKIIPATNR